MKKPSHSRRPVVQTRETLAAALGRARAKAETDYQAYRVARWDADEAERTSSGGDLAIMAGAIVDDAEKRAERSARRVGALESQLESIAA